VSPAIPTVADFGPLTIETDVDTAVIATLKLWFPGYLSRLEDERSLGANYFARPVAASFANTLNDIEFPDHILPAVVVTTAEASTKPTKDGNGRYQVAWEVKVSAVVRGNDPVATRFNAACYNGCVRRIMTQQQDLGGFASEVVPLTHRVQPVADRTNAGRYLAAGTSTYNVLTEDVLSELGGPWLGDDGPYTPPDPTDPDQTYDPPLVANAIHTEVDAVPIGQD
jgi:hypothetical protein